MTGYVWGYHSFCVSLKVDIFSQTQSFVYMVFEKNRDLIWYITQKDLFCNYFFFLNFRKVFNLLQNILGKTLNSTRGSGYTSGEFGECGVTPSLKLLQISL